MATPILKINIDDAAFKRYMSSFEKYQKELKRQPEAWGDVNAAIESTTKSGVRFTTELQRQQDHVRKLAEEEGKREEKLQEAARRREEEAKDQEKREEKAAERRRRAVEKVKEYARSLSDAALSLGKWTLMGQGAGLAAGALSMWGLDRLVGHVADERRLSMGLGVSMGQRQGMGLNMQRYFDVNSTMETVANMQSNPGSWGVFRMMGIDPQGKSSADLTYEAARAARRMFIADKGNLGLAQAQGLTQIFSPDDLRRMAKESNGEFESSISQGKKFSGLSDEVGVKWQRFMIAVDTAGLKIQNALADKLSALENSGALDKMIKGFTDLALNGIDWLGKALTSQDFQTGLKNFSDYISDPQTTAKFKSFIDGVGDMGEALHNIKKFFFPSDKDVADAPTWEYKPGGWGRLWGGIKDAASAVFGDSEKKDMAAALGQFQKWGWTADQASGLVANISSESKFNPFAKGDNGTAYGIGQWHADRQKLYARLFGHTMQSVESRSQAMKEQLEFTNWELHNNESKAGNALRRARNEYEAGALVSTLYERPRDRLGEARRRALAAHQVRLTIKNQTGASVAASTNSAAPFGSLSTTGPLATGYVANKR